MNDSNKVASNWKVEGLLADCWSAMRVVATRSMHFLLYEWYGSLLPWCVLWIISITLVCQLVHYRIDVATTCPKFVTFFLSSDCKSMQRRFIPNDKRLWGSAQHGLYSKCKCNKASNLCRSNFLAEAVDKQACTVRYTCCKRRTCMKILLRMSKSHTINIFLMMGIYVQSVMGRVIFKFVLV